jgi:membrane associated rhomboid family serine protease
MRQTYYSNAPGFFQGGLPQGIKFILIINAAVFMLQIILNRIGIPIDILLVLGLSKLAITKFAIYQIFTYMWLHSTTQFMHILFNMFGIWMFGRELEESWGTRQFIKYYIICGVGAGIVILLLDFLLESGFTLTIGASGALFGLLLASAMSWPDRQVYLYFLFPIKMKYFVIGFGLISFFGLISGGTNISHSGHLGGLLAGYLYIQYKKKGWRNIFKFAKKGPSGAIPGQGSGSSSWQPPRTARRTGNVIHIHEAGKSAQDLNSEPMARKTKEEIWKKKRVDELLDRISLYGIRSLTEEERDFLNQVSKEYKSQTDKDSDGKNTH